MFTLPRHCERSEAIQTGLPRRLRLLAMTLGMFPMLFISNAAFACMESDSFQSRIRKAELIFEGHPVRYEKKQLNLEGISQHPDYQKPWILVTVYKVDKNWKDSEEGDEIKVSSIMSRPTSEEITLPKEPDDIKNTLLILNDKAKLAEVGEVVYASSLCPEDVIQSLGDIKNIQKMLEANWQFQPFWLFYSIKREWWN